MKMLLKTASYALMGALLVGACNTAAPEITEERENTIPSVSHVDWAKHASIYEVNIRQYTPEGTINAFRAKLPEIKALGVKILWIMPVQPIGELNRKGGLGSYYSIKDYTAVNPEFGTMDDFKALVKEAHAMGLKIILDWVANHTAWDAVWMQEHKDWYTQNDSGEVVAPVEDWSDVADLNYENADMRAAMVNALKFWVTETDIDGYRCDVAMMVPMEFWTQVRTELNAIKPVFMLAEAEGPAFHATAFDMTYGWELHHIMNQIAKDLLPLSTFSDYAARQDTSYPDDAIRMYFTTNHDENSWNGTVYERMGQNHLNMFVLAATFPGGMPLVYSGQEAGLNKRLSFFEKDTISWTNNTLRNFYQNILNLKNTHPALANGKESGNFKVVTEDEANSLYAYERSKDGKTLLVILNFGNNPVDFTPKQEGGEQGYKNALRDGYVQPVNGILNIAAHGFMVLEVE
jgi:glycosidase